MTLPADVPYRPVLAAVNWCALAVAVAVPAAAWPLAMVQRSRFLATFNDFGVALPAAVRLLTAIPAWIVGPLLLAAVGLLVLKETQVRSLGTRLAINAAFPIVVGVLAPLAFLAPFQFTLVRLMNDLS